MLNLKKENDFRNKNKNKITINLKNKDFVSNCKENCLILKFKMFTFIFETSAELYLNSIYLEILSTEHHV
tara:strand:- start:289 stop:498 length:210 start_codon:yes stop_codon:yes gene_type:complete